MAGMDDAKLAEGLMKDLSAAQALSAQASTGAGAPAPEDFAPRAMRIKNKIVGEKELASSKRAINKLIEDLSFESGMLDNEQQSVFATKMKTKMNQYKMMLLQNAAALQKHMASKKLDQKQQQAIWAALGSAVGGMTDGIVTNIHDSKKLEALSAVSSGGGGGSAGSAEHKPFGVSFYGR